MTNKIKIISIILSLSAFLIFTSFGRQKSDWKGKIEKKDGIKIIHNFHNNITKPLEFIEDLVIGAEESDEESLLINPIDINADSMGNIYVLDMGDVTIKKYNSQGKYIQSIGRKGQGPGEFQRPWLIQISNQNNINVLDTGSRKITAFRADGSHLNTINTRIPIDQFTINKEDKMIIGYKLRGAVTLKERQPEYTYKVGNYNPETEEFIEFYTREQFKTNRVTDGSFSLEFPVFVRWSINSENKIFVATANKYEISVFSPSGNLSFRFLLDSKPVKIKSEIKEKIMKIFNNFSKRFSINYEKEKKAIEFYPRFIHFSFDEMDRLWVKQYQVYVRDKPFVETTFDIFSSGGIYLFSTRFEKYIIRKPVFKNGYIYALIKDESGYSRALRLKMIEH